MYENFYNLTAKPFQLSPDPMFYFGSTGHRRALSYLMYGVQQGDGFVVITGDVGTGKTTLVGTLFKSLTASNVVAAKLVTTQIQEDDLIRSVAGAFGLEFEGVSKAAILRNLESFFRACVREKKRVLLVVDEAQNLPPRSIEELRMLSNFEMDGKALLQSFLLGQKEFRRTMRSQEFEQLRQRVIAAYHLTPMDEKESREYIEHRLKTAGWKEDPRITSQAYRQIYEFTEGVPRRINTLCDRVLLYGYLENLHLIGKPQVSAVTADIQEDFMVPDETEASAPTLSGSGVSAERPIRDMLHDEPRLHEPEEGGSRLDAVESALETLNDSLRQELQMLRESLKEHAELKNLREDLKKKRDQDGD